MKDVLRVHAKFRAIDGEDEHLYQTVAHALRPLVRRHAWPYVGRVIRWPLETRVNEAVRKDLALFRATSLAQELAADAHTWEVEATSWASEFPVRIILRNEERREVCFTLEANGLFRLVRYENERVGSDSVS